MKKKIVIISVAAVLSIVVLIIIFMQKDSFSLKINGREIREEEFLEAAARKRYEVVSYFSEKGSGGVGENFWEQEVGGELPYEKLTQETLGELRVCRGRKLFCTVKAVGGWEQAPKREN